MEEDNYMNKIISWDEYFMGLAKLSALRSKDPHTQVGAVIIDSNSKAILSMGYNGFPRTKLSNNDNVFPWKSDGENINDNKYAYVVHAELNAILNAHGTSLEGSTLYVTLYPCNECAKAIVQSGITTVYYLDKKNNESEKASEYILGNAGVKCIPYGEFTPIMLE